MDPRFIPWHPNGNLVECVYMWSFKMECEK